MNQKSFLLFFNECRLESLSNNDRGASVSKGGHRRARGGKNREEVWLSNKNCSLPGGRNPVEEVMSGSILNQTHFQFAW